MSLHGDRKYIRLIEKMCHLSPKALFQNSWRKKSMREPAKTKGSPVKRPLKQRYIVIDNVLLVTCLKKCVLGCLLSINR